MLLLLQTKTICVIFNNDNKLCNMKSLTCSALNHSVKAAAMPKARSSRAEVSSGRVDRLRSITEHKQKAKI